MIAASPSISSRDSSGSSGLPSRNSSSRTYRRPRPIVGDTVLICSTSSVQVNVDGLFSAGSDKTDQDTGCDNRNVDMVSERIRNSKDLPKLRNRIFEDSLESQEVSFYVDDDPDESYDNLDFDSDSLDNFDTDSESEHYEDVIVQNQDVINAPLPAPPAEEPFGIVRLARNFRKIKTISKEFGKSLRQLSQRKATYADTSVRVPDLVPEEHPAPITQMACNPLGTSDAQQPYENIFSRLRRSMSLAPEKAQNLTTKLGRHSRSTFYISEPFDADGPNVEGNELTKAHSASFDAKHKLSRPKVPPPPVPVDNRGLDPNQVRLRNKPAPSIQSKINSLYNEAGLFGIVALTNNNCQSRSRNKATTWYAESGLYPKSTNSSASSTKSFGQVTYNNVIDELSHKIGENNSKNRSKTATARSDDSVKSEGVRDNDRENGNDSGTYGSDYNCYNSNSVCSFNSVDSKKDDSSVTYALSEIKFLEDEPLYQFYDEIVSKNLQSMYNSSTSSDDDDSEHYEELVILQSDPVHTPTPSLRSTPPPRPPPPKFKDESRQSSIPSNRSLWCDVPEVANSTVLSTLSTQQKKLQEAKFEILTSEYSYLNSLNVLQEHFVENIEKSNIVNEKEMEILFGKVKQVRHCSKRILHDLEKCWKTNILLDGICDIVQKHAEGNFDVYISYCENQVLIGETLNDIKQREDFRNLLVKLESSSSCKFLSLYSFLMLPMQRITRWPLLVDAILKRLDENDPEYDTCEFALSSLQKVATQCNEAARKKEREIELMKIATKLEFSKTVPFVDIRSPDRWLLRSGTLIRLQPRHDDARMTIRRRLIKTPLELFMFNDFFLVTKKKSDDCFTVLHYCLRSLIEVRHPDDAPEALRKEVPDKYALYIAILENQEGHLVEMFLSCQTETERERWIDALSPPRSENPDEIVYESWDCPQVVAMFNYTAQQPDEFSLSLGDEINVLRKMNDGWYYGERLRDRQTGWFPSNYIKEIPNHHVRAKNIKQRYRILQFSENYLKAS